MKTERSEFSRLSIAIVLASFTNRGGNVFSEPPLLDVDELLPDKFFDWDKIKIGEKGEK